MNIVVYFKNFLQKSISHPLFAGSAVMVIGSNLFNFGQFIFHFLAGRFLGKAAYGDVAGIISILGLVGIIQISLGLTIVKFIASAKNRPAVSNFVKWVDLWTICVGLGVAISTIALSPFIGRFMNITHSLAIYLLGPMLLFFMVGNTGRSVLQGLLKFNHYVLSFLVEAAIKLALTVLFVVLLGYKVVAAIGALFIGILFGFGVTRLFLRNYLHGKRGVQPDVKPLFAYALPVFFQGLALTSMYSTDLILVKHFFSPEQAGVYASLAVLGRISFFGASPITHVMFPLIARRHSHGMPYHNIFFLSVFLVGLISFLVMLLYFLFPGPFIRVLFGQEFLEGAPFLWWFALFMGLLAVAMLFTQFYLSIGKTRVVWLFVVAAFLQIFLIWFIHPNLLTVIQLSIFSAALLVISLLVYFPYHDRK